MLRTRTVLILKWHRVSTYPETVCTGYMVVGEQSNGPFEADLCLNPKRGFRLRERHFLVPENHTCCWACIVSCCPRLGLSLVKYQSRDFRDKLWCPIYPVDHRSEHELASAKLGYKTPSLHCGDGKLISKISWIPTCVLRRKPHIQAATFCVVLQYGYS